MYLNIIKKISVLGIIIFLFFIFSSQISYAADVNWSIKPETTISKNTNYPNNGQGPGICYESGDSMSVINDSKINTNYTIYCPAENGLNASGKQKITINFNKSISLNKLIFKGLGESLSNGTEIGLTKGSIDLKILGVWTNVKNLTSGFSDTTVNGSWDNVDAARINFNRIDGISACVYDFVFGSLLSCSSGLGSLTVKEFEAWGADIPVDSPDPPTGPNAPTEVIASTSCVANSTPQNVISFKDNANNETGFDVYFKTQPFNSKANGIYLDGDLGNEYIDPFPLGPSNPTGKTITADVFTMRRGNHYYRVVAKNNSGSSIDITNPQAFVYAPSCSPVVSNPNITSPAYNNTNIIASFDAVNAVNGTPTKLYYFTRIRVGEEDLIQGWSSTQTFNCATKNCKVGDIVSFSGSASDGTGSSDEWVSASVTITNRAPVLSSVGNKTISEGEALSIALSATDADGHSLNYIAENLPTGATFNAGTGVFSWTPTFSQAGIYNNINFKVNDAYGGNDNETITITVEDTYDITVNAKLDGSAWPSSGNETINYNLGGPLGDISLNLVPKVYNNNKNGIYTITYADDSSGPSGASLSSVNTTSGVLSLALTISDAPITFTFNFTSGNTPPVADDQSVSTPKNTPKPITLTASDANGDSLTWSITNSPTKGALSGTAPNVTYTPDNDYTGSDSFKFKVNDGKVDSNIATVSITVTTCSPGSTRSCTTSLSCDGTETCSAGGSWGSCIDTPSDGCPAGNTNPVADADVGISNPPNGTDVKTTTINEQSNGSTASTNLWGDDSYDAEGPISSYGWACAGPDADFVISSASSVNTTFNPGDNISSNKTYTCTLTVTDAGGLTDTQDVTINVINYVPSNTPPVANDQSVSTPKNTPKPITLTASDANGDSLTWSITNSPTKGALSGTAPNVTYTPDNDYTGSDSFKFKVNDGKVDSNIATVFITVTEVSVDPCNPDIINPDSFSLSSPADGVTGVGSSITLKWNASSDNCEFFYDIYLDTFNPPTQINGSNAEDDLDYSLNLSCGTTYYWNVRARDSANTTASSNGPRSFSTNACPPDFAIALLDPPNPYLIEPTNNIRTISNGNDYNNYRINPINGYSGIVSNDNAAILQKCLNTGFPVGYDSVQCGLSQKQGLPWGQTSKFEPSSVDVLSSVFFEGKIEGGPTFYNNLTANRGNIFEYYLAGRDGGIVHYQQNPSYIGVNRLPKADAKITTSGLTINIWDGDSDGDGKGSYDPDNVIINAVDVQGEHLMMVGVEFDGILDPPGVDLIDKCFLDVNRASLYYTPISIQAFLDANCENMEANPPLQADPWTYLYATGGNKTIAYIIADDLLGIGLKTLNITLTINSPPVAVLILEDNSDNPIPSPPAPGAGVNETIFLDISGSFDPDDNIANAQFCSDDTPGDGACDNAWTGWSDWVCNSNCGGWDSINKEMAWSFATPGDKGVYARVKDNGSPVLQSADSEQTISIFFANQPPTASFTANPPSGNLSTSFTVDGSGSSDPEDATANLEVRWDWEDNGTYDTSWSNIKTNNHIYSSFGLKTIRMEVRDTGGLTDSAIKSVNVNGGPPSADNLSFSAPNYCSSPLQPALSWNFTDPDIGDTQSAFWIQVDNNSNFSSPEINPTNPPGKIMSGSNFFSPIAGQLSYGVAYYWRVKVWDQANAESAWITYNEIADPDGDGDSKTFTTPLHAYPTTNSPTWVPLNPMGGDKVDFTDNSVCYNTIGNTPYACKTDALTNYTWTFQDGNPVNSNTPEPQDVKFLPEGLNKNITLKVADRDNYSCNTTALIDIGPVLPDWMEVPPQ